MEVDRGGDFFNHHQAVAEDSLALGAKPIAGSLTLFREV
jgi:hypothetical protein